MIRVSNIKLKLTDNISCIKEKCGKKLRVKPDEILTLNIFKQSLDARKKDNIHFVYTCDVTLKNEKQVLQKSKDKDISPSPKLGYEYVCKNISSDQRPIVVGFGPAGMFCALILAQMGLKPIVLERGQDVDSRSAVVEEFWATGKLNTESNVQFGEGGAGTFSDGKLTTRIKDFRCRKVLEELINNGAPNEIIYVAKPHVGTDLLKGVVKNIREKIISLGGEIIFNAKVTNLVLDNQKVTGVTINNQETILSHHVVLAIGHSARDTFEMLYENKISMEQKPFAVGVRIEHKQSMINQSQYGDESLSSYLGAAEYKLTYTTQSGRGVFSFCMCPGGQVVAAASEENMIAINGMSNHARDEENANSALLVQVYPKDFNDSHVLAGIQFQRDLEKKAFQFGGGNYNAPCQLVGDFLKDQPSTAIGDIKNTYRPNVTPTDLRNVLPEFITDAIKEAIPNMATQIKGYDLDDALLTAVESRSSSPVRIVRDANTLQSTNIQGLYPIGEGAGYAGGIVSAAVDGIIAAEKLALNIVENCKG